MDPNPYAYTPPTYSTGDWVSGMPTKDEVPDNVFAFATIRLDDGSRGVGIGCGNAIRRYDVIGWMKIEFPEPM